MAVIIPGRISFLQIEGAFKLADPAEGPGEFVRMCEDASPNFINISKRLAVMLDEQVKLLEAEPLPPGFNEDRVKSLLALSKVVQVMEALSDKLLETENGKFDEPQDILEFRRQLEKKIDALGAGGADK